MPRFSIVVPSHGVAGRLSLALDSVLAQSFGDFELIAVCDGPAAPAAGVAADHAARDSRVVLVHSPPSEGLGAARNAGVRAASGLYLLFLDGDDVLAPGALAALAARLEETGEVDVLYFEHERSPWWDGEPTTTAGPAPVAVRAPSFSPAEAPRLTGVALPAWSAAYRRSFVTAHDLAFPEGHFTDVGWGGLVTVAAERVAVLRRVVVRHLLRRQGSRLDHVLPCGTTAMRPMTEGLMLALTLAALWGCSLALDGRVRAGTVLVAGALLALFAVKHSQALFLGLSLAAAGAAVAVRRWTRRRPAGRGVLAVTAVACGAAVGTVLLARALRYPTGTDSVQDLLTGHYALPDRDRPWPELLRLEGSFWLEWLRRQLWQPLFAALLAAGAWGALRRRGAFGLFVVATALTGFLTQAAHPDITVWGERLIVVAWLLPVVGVPLLLERVALRPAADVPGPRPRSLPDERSPVTR
ncbi:glycosyltransferase family 2 protein [Streptomyces sp. NPDC017179]|uniref:glycosyltransferase family 2 protein n=1 Tax=Streptomyces sp. NPDC017179 TaxID=3364979 RepID=UPI0037890A23